MKSMFTGITVLALTSFALTACNDKTAEPSSHSTAHSSSVAAVSSEASSLAAASSIAATPALTDSWAGKWNGPEGTFLEITGSNGRYALVIQDLDGPKTYEGVSNQNQIEFQRNGETETIRATNGAETGMKWLTDKVDCLTIHTGEGFCRD